MNHFDRSFDETMENEGRGELTNDALDPGGETFSGISRVYWPEWKGWKLIDDWQVDRSKKFPGDQLDVMVRDFYRQNFWNRIQGDKLSTITPWIAYEVFDSAVNVGVHQAVKFLQEGFNVARGNYFEPLVVDGKLGPKTIKALQIYFDSMPGSSDNNEAILLNCMNGEQYCFYKANPKHQYFRGWFRRV